jgi:CBS domain-containing protein
MMSENKITALFVTDAADRPVGIIRMHDCVRAGSGLSRQADKERPHPFRGRAVRP